MYISLAAREEAQKQTAAFLAADNDRIENDAEYAAETADYVDYLLGR